MNLKSIRWKLPLTYAGIALITALVSGGTLILILRGYYQAQEQAYLQRNAVAISDAVTPLLKANEPLPDLKPHLTLFAFLSQTHVRLLDTDGKEIADFNFSNGTDPSTIVSAMSLSKAALASMQRGSSTDLDLLKTLTGAAGDKAILTLELASPDQVYGPVTSTSGQQTGIRIFYGTQVGSSSDPTQAGGNVVVHAVPSSGSGDTTQSSGSITAQPVPAGGSDAAQAGGSITAQPVPTGGSSDPTLSPNAAKPLVAVFPATGTMYGFNLQGSTTPIKARSDQVFTQPLYAADGRSLGSIQLSQGPSYGLDIVNAVAGGWAIASLLAILIAAAAGLWISRRMSAPLLVLTASTRRMAAGDLSVRAGIRGGDEIGALGSAFNAMAGRVEETISALRRFVADAAHELQTPLTALRTNLELASGEAEAARQLAYLESAQGQVERLNHLVRDLLDLSRLEAGADGSQKAPLDLSSFVQQLSEPYAAQAEQAGIELNVALPAQALTVCADEKQLRHAAGNLLENALKFTPPGGAVTVSLAQEDGWACLSVADTGIGIRPEDLAGLFQRFHRGRNVAGYPGSGLGLAIVQAVAQAHGGQVQYENQPVGSRFTLRLPTS